MQQDHRTIVLEGAPAAGKSTLAKFLAEHHDYFRIAEVNELFPNRPEPQPKFWYCERQIDRYVSASQQKKSVLDGDPLQAIWFSWIYPNRGFIEWSKSIEFFHSNAHLIALPSFYVRLHVGARERYEREKGRERLRGRCHSQFLRKWERYCDFSGPHSALFDAMSNQYPGWVISLESTDLETTAHELLRIQPMTPPSPSELLEWITGWLKNNTSDEYRQAG